MTSKPNIKLKRNSVFEEVGDNLHVAVWSTVDADNEFTYDGITYFIADTCKQYQVFDKYDEIVDYKNRSEMTKILVMHLKNGFVQFYDERYDPVYDIGLKMPIGSPFDLDETTL